MAYFPSLAPAPAPPVTQGTWANNLIAAVDGSTSMVRVGSMLTGKLLELTFPNISESDFLSILNHYRGQRSGFDAFSFTNVTLPVDQTPAGYSWRYLEPPQVVDDHLNCFTVSCRFRCEPRGTYHIPGADWISSQSTLTVGARDGGAAKAWISSATTFTPGAAVGGASVAGGKDWASTASTLTPGAASDGVSRGATAAWVSSATTFTPGAASGAAVIASGAAWVSGSSTLLPGLATGDNDVATFIAAVETADGQALEAGVKTAYGDFIAGCKADGIWDAIKACCILAGARTLAGALVPLRGTAPTNYGFVSGDYNRKTGLTGTNGASKYLDTNRATDADPLNNVHMAVYESAHLSALGGCLMGSFNGHTGGGNYTDMSFRWLTPPLTLYFSNRSDNFQSATTADDRTGFYGSARNNSSSFTIRSNNTSTTANKASTSASSYSYLVFAGRQLVYGQPAVVEYAPHGISFYSAGEYLDLALLNARANTLMAAINSAIA